MILHVPAAVHDVHHSPHRVSRETSFPIPRTIRGTKLQGFLTNGSLNLPGQATPEAPSFKSTTYFIALPFLSFTFGPSGF